MYAKQLWDAEGSPTSSTNRMAAAGSETGEATATNLLFFTSTVARTSSVRYSLASPGTSPGASAEAETLILRQAETVSYTHLTLPTILLV